MEVCAATHGLKHDQGDDNLRLSLQQLHVEVKRLHEEFMAMKNGTVTSHKLEPVSTLANSASTPPTLPATVIKFTWYNTGVGPGVQAHHYNNDDGLYDGECSWESLRVSNTGYQYGSFNTVEESRGFALGREIERTITFSTPFANKPEVVVWLTGLDMRGGKLWKVNTSVIQSSKASFKFCIRTFGEGVLYSAGISWVAHEAKRLVHSRFVVPVYSSSETSGAHYYHGHRQPERQALVVDEVVSSGQVEWPFRVYQTSSSAGEIAWTLSGSSRGSSICLLGVRYIIACRA